MIVYMSVEYVSIYKYQIISIFGSLVGNKILLIKKKIILNFKFLEGNLVSFLSKKKYVA